MLPPVSSPVIPVLFYPALLGISLVIPVVRIALYLLALPTASPDALALLSVTVSVSFYPRIRNKKTSAFSIGTSDLLAHGFPPGETITSFIPLHDKKQEPNST